MIDLRLHFDEFTALVRETLLRFEEDNPQTRWSCYAFDAAPVYGFLRLNFDTRQSSEAILGRFQHNGPDWYGEDKGGRFNNNCADFGFCAFVELDIPAWMEEFEEHHEEFQYRSIDGDRHQINMEWEGNEGFNRIIYDLLERVCNEVLPWVVANSKNRENISRFGVQMCDSKYSSFTLLPASS